MEGMAEEESAVVKDRRAGERRSSGPPWHRLMNRPGQFVLDLAVLSSAFLLSYVLRFEFEVPPRELHNLAIQVPLVLLLQFGAMQIFGIYTFMWRYIGMAEIGAFLKAAWWSFLPLVLMRLGFPDDYSQWRVPLSICMMTTVFGFGGVLALRVLRRAVFEGYEKRLRSEAAKTRNGRLKPVLLVGAGRAGVQAAREIVNRGDMDLEIVGFVDDDPLKQGTVIQGFKVIGTTGDLPRLVRELGVHHVVITIAQAARADIRRIVEICESVPVKAQIIPGLYQILSGTVEISRIRDVEIEDLLGREAVVLEEDLLRSFLAGKTVMVTGAGGSIGAELARQVAHFEAGATAAGGAGRVRALRDRPRAALAIPGARDRAAGRRRLRPRADARAVREAPAVGGPPRGRPQARTDDGVEPDRGGQEQHPRHPRPRRGGGGDGRRVLYPDLDRQGGTADVDHGGLEEGGGARHPGPEPAP